MWHYQITKDKEGYAIREIVEVDGKTGHSDPITGYYDTKADLIADLDYIIWDCNTYDVLEI